MQQGLLFSDHFLRDGIKSMPEYGALITDGNTRVAAMAQAMRGTFEKFPIDRHPDETQTEDDLIYPVLDALGWNRDRWLAQARAAKKGRADVPDMLLFAAADDKQRANTEKNAGDRYRHGIAIVENKRWQRPLDRKDKGRARSKDEDDEVPSTQMLRYLSRAETLSDRRIQWGVLTNGRLWRLYHQGAKSRSEEYVEIDLPVLLGIERVPPDLFAPKADEREHWLRVLVLLFGRESFTKSGDGGRSFHQVALDEGRRWEERVADDLSRIVFGKLFPALATALDEAHPAPVRPRSPTYLAEIKQSALILLYRLLFILYAEDRDLLPVRDKRYDDYALSGKRDDIARRLDNNDAFSRRASNYFRHVRDLCRIIDGGDAELGVPSYNGGLFAVSTAPLLDRIEIPDVVFAQIVDDLSRHDDGTRKRRINYRDLSVQQLGSIYERLLEFDLIEDDGAIKVAGDQEGRKGSGSYYTPEELVRLILERTIGPLLAERMTAFQAKADELAKSSRPKSDRLAEILALDPATRFLDIKVCDPAMGSGHFLVSLVDYLADHILEAIAVAPRLLRFADAEHPYVSPLTERIEQVRKRILALAKTRNWRVEEAQLDDRRLIRRMILKRVIHGVDKNPMAVELAKVALWLHTFTVGAPLSFLDHHLHCGDSLLGAWVRPTADWLESRGSLLINRYIGPAERTAATMAEIETITDTDIAEVEDSKAKYETIAEATGPLAAFLSLVQAERLMGVFDAAPAKRPPSVADLERGKATPAAIARARKQWAAYEPALAFQGVLDGTYGDPVRIAAGSDTVASAAMVEQLALLPDDPPDQAALFGDAQADERRRMRAHKLVERARAIAEEQRFLHWEVAFPNVWRNWMSKAPAGGFDAVIGNPPYVRQESLSAIKPALKHGYESFDGVADLYVYFYELGLRLLRPGGRLSYVVTNKWLKAGYAESLRGLFADRAWMELIADFGHAKQFFRDADVFPCVIVARKPDASAPPAETEACIIPREDVRPADLIGQVQREVYRLPRIVFTRSAWVLEPPAVMALMNKIRAAGLPLAEFAGVKPYRGVLTGLNEAFLIDTATRGALIAADPNCTSIIKPYLRGQDVDRWYAPWKGMWMIFTRRGININAYPSVLAHLQKFRTQLEPRPVDWIPTSSDDQWPGRKPGPYAWYEVQDSTAYYEIFEQPKIVYNDITWNAQFSVDRRGFYVNNTVYALPTTDAAVVAVLNAPIGWWFAWRAAQHGKDEALRYFNTFVEEYPIPPLAEQNRIKIGVVVDRLIVIHHHLHETRSSLMDWYRHAHDIDKPSAKLRDPFMLDAERFTAEVKKAIGRKATLSAAAIKAIKAEHARTVAPAQALLAEADRLERRISDLVNEAYGLTPDEVKLMWETAPPRMPIAAPGNGRNERPLAAS